jgi:hypothetical protein
VTDVTARGVPSDGTADAAAPLQALIDAGERALYLPPGAYLFRAPLRLWDTPGLSLRGAGRLATTLHWSGPPNAPAVWMKAPRHLTFADLGVAAGPAAPLAEAFRLETWRGGRFAPSRCCFDRVTLSGGNPAGLGYGFRCVAGDKVGGDGADANNEGHRWRDCDVAQFGEAAWSFEHSQSVQHDLDGCVFLYGGKHGVRHLAGSFHWHGAGWGVGVTESDFYLGDVSATLTIRDGRFEGSPRFILGTGPSGAGSLTVVEGNGWSGDKLHPDGRGVVYMHRGPFVFRGNRFGFAERAPRLFFATINAYSPCVLVDIEYNAFLAARAREGPFLEAAPGLLAGECAGNLSRLSPADQHPTLDRRGLVQAADGGDA